MGARRRHAGLGSTAFVPDKAGEQRVFDWRRRKQAIVGGMNHGLGFCDVVRQANARAGLLVRVHEVEMVVAKAQVHGQVSNGREMVLHVETGLPALAPTLERRENLWVTTAVEEKAFPFAQPDEVNSALKK